MGKKLSGGLMLIILCWALPAVAGLAVDITFDDLATPNDKGTWGIVPEDYQGFSWQYIEVVNADAYAKSFGNSKIVFPSRPNAAYNGGPEGGFEVVTLAANSPFELEGAYFSTWAQKNKLVSYSSRGLTVSGYLKGKAVGSSAINLVPNFVWHSFDFGPVDLVEFRHTEKDNAHWWLMDNLKVALVPLPATLALFCLGLIGLLFFGRRRLPDRIR